MPQVPPLLLYALVLVLSFLVCAISIPSIIHTAEIKHLFDEPDTVRKLHGGRIPNLGGMAIFFAFTIVTSVCANTSTFPNWNLLIGSAIILFVTGLKDDLVGLNPTKKFAAQFLAAFIVLYFGGLQIQDLHGLFGIHHLPIEISLFLNMFGLVFVINAYNLIDGVDGLAGSLGLLAFSCFGAFFAWTHQTGEAVLSLAMVGALLGFLKYNLHPAKIFMGDTGSLLIGFLCGVFCLSFVKAVPNDLTSGGLSKGHVFLIALSIIFIPVLDTFRVFAMRILRKKSPFFGDRTHIHHILLDGGMNHSWATATILLANICLIALAYLCKPMSPTLGFLVLTGAGLIFIFLSRARRQRQMQVRKPAGTSALFVSPQSPDQGPQA